MKKRLLALAIVLVMIISMLPVTAFAAVPSKVKLYNYSPARKDLESVPSSTYLSSRVKYITVIDNTDTTEGAPAKVLSYPTASSTASNNPQDNFARYEYKIDSEGKGTVYLHLKNFDTTGLKQTDNGAFFQIGYSTSDNYDTVITLEGTNKLTGAWEAIVIKGSGEVTITGSGSLHLYTNVQENDLFRIEGAGNLTIKDTTVTGHINTETNAKPGLRNAFTVNGNITVDGSNVDLIVNNGAAFRTATSSTGGLKANNVTIKNGSNVKVKQNAGQDAIVENSNGVLTIENSTVEFEGNNNGSLALKHAPTLVGNYSSQVFSVWPTTDSNFAATKYTPETAFATNVRYFKFVHECVAQEDDGDCLTPIMCACTKTVVIPGAEEHSFTTKASEQLVEGTATVYYVQCDNCNVVSEDITIDTSSGEVVCNHPNAPEQTDCTVEVICPDCEEVVYAAKEHTPGAEATCTTAQVCTVCNAEIVAAKGHPLKAVSAKAPTCTESGYDHYKFCPICERYFYWSTSSTAANNKDKTGYSTMNNWYKEALGHTEGEPTVDPETYEIVISCVTCQAELSRVPGEIPEPECTHENAPAQEFCDVAVNCPDCGEEVYAAKDHTEGAAADCENDQICTVCEKVLVEKLNHKPGAEADCENDQICTVCEKILVEKLGHKPGAAADCENDQICTVCEKILVEKLGHKPGAAATCTTNQTCTECGKELAPAEGHRYGSMQVFTFCEEEGYIIIGCNKCGGEWDSRTDKEAQDYLAEMNENPYINIDLSAKGHKEVIVEGKDATCTEDGLTDGKYCEVCNKTLEEQKVITAAGHKYDQKVIERKYRKSAATINAPAVFYFVCECGEKGEETFEYGTKASGAVASIDGYNYATVAEAIQAAKGTDKVVVLLKDFKNASAILIDGDVTIDFGGYTYTVETDENGAALVITSGKVTLKNGKLQVRYSARNEFANLIVNNGTLITENITLNGANLYAEGETATIVNNGALEVKAGTVITAKEAALAGEGAVTKAEGVVLEAMEGYHWTTEGVMEKHSFTTTSKPATVYEVSYDLHECACGESYKDNYGTKRLSTMATIGDERYATLQEAIDAAEAGAVIKLARKVNDGAAIELNKNVTIDLNGYVYTVATAKNGAAVVVAEGVEATLTNGTVQLRYAARADFEALVENNGILRINNATLKGNALVEGAVLVKGNEVLEVI